MKKLIYLFTTLMLATSINVFAQNPADSTDVYGCMDSDAMNYNPLATIDNGYCMYYCDSTTAYFYMTSNFEDSLITLQSFTFSSSNITSYFWDFGDGSTSSLQYPNHLYLEDGAYDICLTITAPGQDVDTECTNTYCDSLFVIAGANVIVTNDIYGCTDPVGLNYNPNATVDNGTCIYDDTTGTDVYGCTDPIAINYNPLATINDGSCFYDNDTTLFDVFGCMDTMAINYNPLATIDDGSCFYTSDSSDVYGCMDPTAINYNQFATIDDGSCIYPSDSTNVFGCTDTSALNYNPLATIDDGSCFYYCDSIVASFYLFEVNEDDGIVTIVNNSPFTPPGTTYMWDFGDSTYSTEAYPSHEYEFSGMYNVCLTVTSAAPTGGGICVNTFCLTVGIQLFGGQMTDGMTINVISETATGINKQIENLSEIKLYPNPAYNNLTLSFNLNSEEEFTTTIYDLSGRVVQSNTNSFGSGNNELSIDINDLNTGMYQIELRNNNSRNVMRFQVIK